jgi:hypothetical protein
MWMANMDLFIMILECKMLLTKQTRDPNSCFWDWSRHTFCKMNVVFGELCAQILKNYTPPGLGKFLCFEIHYLHHTSVNPLVFDRSCPTCGANPSPCMHENPGSSWIRGLNRIFAASETMQIEQTGV